MRKWAIAALLVGAFGLLAAGCGSGSGDEPTETQKTVVPEAKGGAPVTKDGDKFTRQSDRN